MNITEFLTARIDEEEEIAQAALAADHDLWVRLSSPFGPIELSVLPDLDVSMGTIDHLRRNNPIMVSAHCQARRMILNALDATSMSVARMQIEEVSPATAAGFDLVAFAVLQHMVMPYFTHPDFNLEWAP